MPGRHSGAQSYGDAHSYGDAEENPCISVCTVVAVGWALVIEGLGNLLKQILRAHCKKKYTTACRVAIQVIYVHCLVPDVFFISAAS